MNAASLPLAKVLVDPLLGSLALMIVGLAGCWIVRRRSAPRRSAVPLVLVTAAWLILTLLSMPATSSLLESWLAIPRAESGSPDYIVVLAGGYHIGSTPDLDVLSSTTLRRVLFGVRYWKSHRRAPMVMAGSLPTPRDGGRMSELMAEAAVCRGVPAGSILRETRAHNTREHPIGLLALPGITPASRLAIVTSVSHERRAVREFRRYFAHVDPQPTADPENVPTTSFADFLPQVEGLTVSTQVVQEWIGMAWYQLQAMRRPTPIPAASRAGRTPS